MYKIDVVTDDGGWYNFNGDTKFQIIPFNFSLISPNMLKDKFMNSLINWEGLVDTEGEVFECNEYNKEYLYNYYNEIREFVFEKSIIKIDKEEEIMTRQEIKKYFKKEMKFNAINVYFITVCWFIAALFSVLTYYKLN